MGKKFYQIVISIVFFLVLFSSEVLAQTVIIIPPGATLSGLAIEYETTIPVLLALNPNIKDPNLIYAGDELKIPPPTTKIVIPPGATLWSLAKEYNTTVSLLLALNPKIKNPDLIFAGDELIVPKPIPPPAPPPPSPPPQLPPSPPTTTEATTTQEIKPTLSVSLSANPSLGTAPLTGVDLIANVYGTATGSINYIFYCNRPDSETNITSGYCYKIENVGRTSFTAFDCCDYSPAGTYSAKVIVERGGLVAESRVEIVVAPPEEEVPPSPPPPPPPPPPPAGPPSCQGQYPSGVQTYSVATKTIPKIYQIVVDPLNVNYLASQTVSVSISDTNPITQVSGQAITDTKTVNFTLNLISGSQTDGVWQGSWVLQDSICQNYQIAITATSQSGTSKVTLTFK
jgi:LysM repeat protein